MRRVEAACAAIALTIVVTGCGTSAVDRAPPQPDRPWHPMTDDGGGIVPGPASTAATNDGYVLPSNRALSEIPPGPPIDRGRVYSLVDLIDLAESTNPTTRIAWNDARRAALVAGIARSTYLPRLTATVAGAAIDTSSHDSGSNVQASSHGLISALTLEWLLFDFGERSSLVEAAEQTSVVSNIAFTAAHQRVIYDVSVAFYAHAASRAAVIAATHSQQNAAAVQAAAEDRFAHGVGTTVEVAQARQAAAQAELARVRANGAASDTYLALLAAVGISPLTQLDVADVSDRPLPVSSKTVDTFVTDALSRRPDLLGAYAAQKASQASLRAAEAEFMPKVFVAATGAYNSDDLTLAGIPSVGQQAATLNVSGNHYVGSVLAG
ncbi:MAG TPA: TolC family protein, partial [Pseudomonadales bacterium]|nr:TolC family protein [Pseudomonadales bacterium]